VAAATASAVTANWAEPSSPMAATLPARRAGLPRGLVTADLWCREVYAQVVPEADRAAAEGLSDALSPRTRANRARDQPER
jgi:hypothetical protein